MMISVYRTFYNLFRNPTTSFNAHYFVHTFLFLMVFLVLNSLSDPLFASVVGSLALPSLPLFLLSAIPPLAISVVATVALSFFLSEAFCTYTLIHAFFHPSVHPFFSTVVEWLLYFSSV